LDQVQQREPLRLNPRRLNKKLPQRRKQQQMLLSVKRRSAAQK
jgi:hypothetical protein